MVGSIWGGGGRILCHTSSNVAHCVGYITAHLVKFIEEIVQEKDLITCTWLWARFCYYYWGNVWFIYEPSGWDSHYFTIPQWNQKKCKKGLFQSIITLILFQIKFYMLYIFYTLIIKFYQLSFRMGQSTFNSNYNHCVGYITAYW